MNMNQVVNMITRILMRRGINAGINRGMDALSRRNRGQADQNTDDQERSNSDRNDRTG